jgi:hypothetical protein
LGPRCPTRRGEAPSKRHEGGSTYLYEGIDGKDDEFGLRLSVRGEVEVDELLPAPVASINSSVVQLVDALLEVVGLHVLEDVGKEAADILSRA